MSEKYIVDDKDRQLLKRLQEGIPVATRPYKEMADILGIAEDELILRLKRLKERGLIKRIDFRLNLQGLGFSSTLVAWRVPKKDIPKAKEIISSCKNVTHNYLRQHELNMWFTLSAASRDKLQELLASLKERVKPEQMLSFQTEKTVKLGFCLNVE